MDLRKELKKSILCTFRYMFYSLYKTTDWNETYAVNLLIKNLKARISKAATARMMRIKNIMPRLSTILVLPYRYQS